MNNKDVLTFLTDEAMRVLDVIANESTGPVGNRTWKPKDSNVVKEIKEQPNQYGKGDLVVYYHQGKESVLISWLQAELSTQPGYNLLVKNPNSFMGVIFTKSK